MGTALLGLGLAACGGSTPTTTANTAVIARDLGCTGFSSSSDPSQQGTPWSKTDATCGTWNGGQAIEIVTFANQANEDTWVAYPASDPEDLSGNSPGVDVSGPGWAVTVSNQTQASRVVALIGGTAH